MLRRLRAVIQQHMLLSAPLSEKANSTQGINGIGKGTRREDVNVGVVGHLETISNPSFPKGPGQTWHKRGTSQANVKSK